MVQLKGSPELYSKCLHLLSRTYLHDTSFLSMKWTRKLMLENKKSGEEMRGLLKISIMEAGGFCSNYQVDCIRLPLNFSESNL